MDTRKRWISVAILAIAAIMTLSGCTRERIVEETLPSSDQQAQEPVVVQLDAPLPTATATPVPTPVDTPEPKVIPYEVRPGDMISTIAERFGTDSQTIRKLNLLASDDLQVGQLLRVPNIPGETTPEGLPTPTPEPFEYIIQRGDTLLSIAIRFDVTLNELIVTNSLTDQHNLVIGQTLRIPALDPSASNGANAGGDAADTALSRTPGTHTIRSGETLAIIAQHYGVALTDLIAVNSISNPHIVSPNTVLIIPGLTAADVKILNQTVYTVQTGDSLSSIAQQFDVDVDAIVEANDIQNPHLLRSGDQLIIPEPEP